MKFKARPMPGYVICESRKENQVTKGGIVVPETARKNKLGVQVVAIHPDDAAKYNIAVGDLVLVTNKTEGGVGTIQDGDDMIGLVSIECIVCVILEEPSDHTSIVIPSGVTAH